MTMLPSGTIINDKKPVNRADYGVRVARNGYDAATCADSDLLFNSGWRIIQIVKVLDESRTHHDDNMPSFPLPDGWQIKRQNWGDGVWNWDYCVDEKWLYLPGYQTVIAVDPQGDEHRYYEGDKVYHGLGYVPLFFKSEFCSDTPGYILLTNIDIRQDVDYPYTNAPSHYYGGTNDYGIKSKSYTRNDIPEPGETRGCGINTSIQSKMVMAIKTEKSKAKEKYTWENPVTHEIEEVEAGCPTWAVPQDENSQTTKLYDYEAFGFWSPDGVIFQEYPIGGMGQNRREIYSFIDQWGAAVDDTKKSLVILRSPMVAPDIEEITIQ